MLETVKNAFQNSLFGAVVLFSLFSLTSVYATVNISEPINGDIYAPSGVLFENTVPQPVANGRLRTSQIAIPGIGTVTVGNGQNDYPRLGLVAGSVISVDTYIGQDGVERFWSGAWSAPTKRTSPSGNSIVFADSSPEGTTAKVIQAYRFGTVDEVFSFNARAEMVFSVEEPEGTELFFAFDQGGSVWTVWENSRCVVTNGLCRSSVGRVDSLALVQKVYPNCPTTSVENGKYGLAPECRIICDQQYEWDPSVNNCQLIDKVELTLEDLEAELNAEISVQELIEPEATENIVTQPVLKSAPKVVEPVVEAAPVVAEDKPKSMIRTLVERVQTETAEPLKLEPAVKSVPKSAQYTGDKQGFIVKNGKRYATPDPFKRKARSEAKQPAPVVVPETDPDTSMMSYIKAAATAMAGSDGDAGETNMAEISRISSLPDNMREALNTAGPAPLLALMIAGMGLVALGRQRK